MGMTETVIYWTGQRLVVASANADVPGRIQAELYADGRSQLKAFVASPPHGNV
jgi:hypothetical protein